MMKHSEKWLKTLIDTLDAQVDEETRARLLEACGRACISRSAIKEAKTMANRAQNLDELLDALNQQHIGGGKLRREGDVIYGVYNECYCSLARSIADELSPTFCNCSRGWLKELFESALEESVEVEILQSVVRGDEICEFAIHRDVE